MSNTVINKINNCKDIYTLYSHCRDTQDDIDSCIWLKNRFHNCSTMCSFKNKDMECSQYKNIIGKEILNKVNKNMPLSKG